MAQLQEKVPGLSMSVEPVTGRKTVKDALKSGVGFVGSSVGLMVAQMLANILVIRWLEPHDTGVWQTLMLIQSYAGFAQLGLFSGLNRELPFLLGKDQESRARTLISTVQGHAIFCVLTVLALSGAVLLLMDLEPRWQMGVGMVGISTAASLYFQYLAVIYRGTQRFSRLSIANGVQALFALGSVPMVFFWGFEGLCARIAILALCWVGLLHVGRPVRVPPGWDWSAIRQLLAAGGPAFGLGYLLTIAYGLDRLLLLEAGGVVLVGLYAPAGAAKVGLAAIPAAINAYMSPKLSHRLGETRDPGALWSLTWKAAVGTTLLMIPIAAVGWWTMPWLIEAIFPKYAEGSAAAQVICLSGLFLSCRAVTCVLSTLKAWWEFSILNVLTLLLLWLLPWYFARHSEEGALYGIAFGWVCACALLFPIGLGLMYRATHKGTSAPVEGAS